MIQPLVALRAVVKRDALLTGRQAVPACYPRDKIPVEGTGFQLCPMQTLARHILVIWALAILLPSAKLVNETRSGEISSGEETALKSQIWYENQTD